MRHPQLIVCDQNPALIEPLRELARRQGRAYRPRQQPGACARLLERGNPAVLVLRLGADLANRSVERELRLLERAAVRFPTARAVVVADADSLALAALAWDLGASWVLSPFRAHEQLLEILVGLMRSAAASLDHPAASA